MSYTKEEKAAYGKAWRAANPSYSKVYNKAYYSANSDKEKKRSKVHRKANPGEAKAYSKAYYKANPDKAQAASKAYKEANPDKIKMIKKAWQTSNLDKANASNAKRRAAKLKRTPSWADLETTKQVYADCKEINLAAATAGCSEKFVVDHIIPLQGELVSGLHIASNLQIITAKANNEKNNNFIPG